MKNIGSLCLIFQLLCIHAANAKPWRSYSLYQPDILHTLVYQAGTPDVTGRKWLYNHCASIAFFNGQYHTVWNAHKQVSEGIPGQVILWSASKDLIHWTEPQVLTDEGSENPVITPEGVQWQPNLLVVGNELWCVWSVTHPERKSRETKDSGTWLSRLSTNNVRWTNSRIFNRYEYNGLKTLAFPSQNPFVCTSGRILIPVTFIYEDQGFPQRWNGIICTDDQGKTWQVSNLISQIDDPYAEWEPFFYEQDDGSIRGFMRNLTRLTPRCQFWQLTVHGTGSEKGSELILEEDPVFDMIETANSRMHAIRLKDGRYCQFQHDCVVNQRGYDARYNLALFFSRSGVADYVASVPFSRPEVISAYPQGTEGPDGICVAYTVNSGRVPRSIEVARITAPSPACFFLWPRRKDRIDMDVLRNKEGNLYEIRKNTDYKPPMVQISDGNCFVFQSAASLGVETDPIRFEQGDTLHLKFEFKVLALSDKGFLTLCTMGDHIPIRVAIPANRPDSLYVYANGGWQIASKIDPYKLTAIELSVGTKDFTLKVNDQEPLRFTNPVQNPSPRLYLGEGFDLNFLENPMKYRPTGSFEIVKDSIQTKVTSVRPE